jgi:hypothetical protein
MASDKPPENLTLLDVLIDAFEKNEILDGFHWRSLPMPDEAAAVRKFASLSDEAARWKGSHVRYEEREHRRLVAWDDLEIRQAGRGVMVRARAPRLDGWWHDRATWEGDPMGALYDWIREERSAESSDANMR